MKKIYVIYKTEQIMSVNGYPVDCKFNKLVAAFFDENKAKEYINEINSYEYTLQEVKILDGEISSMEIKIQTGTPVVATYGYNKVTNKPYQFLYEFGYYSDTGGCVVYKQGERNMQDSLFFKKDQIKIATEEDLNILPWGI